jgi:hypothetical protein
MTFVEDLKECYTTIIGPTTGESSVGEARLSLRRMQLHPCNYLTSISHYFSFYRFKLLKALLSGAPFDVNQMGKSGNKTPLLPKGAARSATRLESCLKSHAPALSTLRGSVLQSLSHLCYLPCRVWRSAEHACKTCKCPDIAAPNAAQPHPLRLGVVAELLVALTDDFNS